MAIPSITATTINAYTQNFNSLSSPALEDLLAASAKRQDILPCILRDTACLLQFLVRLIQPQQILELGTGIGVSTLILADVLPSGGKITTIERIDSFIKEAIVNFQRFGAEEKISVYHGDVLEVIPRLHQQYDFIFQDSGKQTYLPTLNRLVDLLRPGGLLVVDDTLFPAMDLPERNRAGQRVLNQFNLAVREHPHLISCILPIGHGITIAQKLDKNR